jgi:hypothetical protein
MKQGKGLLRKPAFRVFLFLVCFVLFGWPLMSVVGSQPAGMFIYLFAVWGIVIILLFFMSRSYDRTADGDKKLPDRDKPDV